jgi:predicted nucleic acid-binding protein
MIFATWQPGQPITPPIYLDANVLVGASVSQHRLYRSCATLLGDLLSNNWKILLSDLAFSESQWAIARISYSDLNRQPSDAHFSKRLYLRWASRVFNQYGPRFQAISVLVKRLTPQGFPIDVVPQSIQEWSQVMDLSYQYMQTYGLTPADAIHLGLAQTHAQTFVTGDGDFFSRLHTTSSGSGLTVLHLSP